MGQLGHPHAPEGLRPAACWTYLAVTAGLALAATLWPEALGPVRFVSLAAAIAAVVAGVAGNRPAARLPWLLIGVALCFDYLGSIALYVNGQLNVGVHYRSILADVFFLCAFPFLAGGLIAMLARRTGDIWRPLTDAVLVAGGVALGTWTTVVSPALRNRSLDSFHKVTAIAPPVADSIVLMLALRLLTAGAQRNRSARFLTVGAAVLFASAIHVSMVQLNPGWRATAWTHLGAFVVDAMVGAAALHPDMRRLGEPADEPARRRIDAWAVGLTVLVFLGPATLYVQSQRDELRYGELMAAVTAMTFAVALVRLPHATAARTRAMDREYFGSMLSHASDTFLVVSPDCLIRSASRASPRLFGTVELDGEWLTRYLPVAQGRRLRAALHRACEEAGAESAARPGRIRAVRRNGAQKDLPGSGPGSMLQRRPRLTRLGPAAPGLAARMSFEAPSANIPAARDRGAASFELQGNPGVSDDDGTGAAPGFPSEGAGTPTRPGSPTSDHSGKPTGPGDLVDPGVPGGVGAVAAVSGIGAAGAEEVAGPAGPGPDGSGPGSPDPDADPAALAAPAGGDWPMRLTLLTPRGERQVEAFCETLPTTSRTGDLSLTLRDVTELWRLNRELRYLAGHAPVDDSDTPAGAARASASSSPSATSASGTGPDGEPDPLGLSADLDEALAGEGLSLRYQPVVQMATGRVSSFEALVRWTHPTKGPVPPDVLIPLAERTGQIRDLGRWVLRNTLRAARDWGTDTALPPVRVGFNVSVYQLRQPGFVDDVRAALAETGVAPGALVVEVTESAVIGAGDDRVRARLDVLRDLGVGLAVDDFGTGYSSLSYLWNLPVDTLKIDKSFTDRLATSARMAALVAGIVRIADSLGMRTLAEGVETAEQRDLLLQVGCDEGQGYLYSRPLTAEDATSLLRAGGYYTL